MNRVLMTLTIAIMSAVGVGLFVLADRREVVAEAPKSQTPVAPFPYLVEEFAIDSPDQAVIVGGTLTIPEGNGPFPAIALLSVAGPNDRDQSFAGHKGFMVLADRLTRAGFAVARYDDRGVGASTGDYFAASWRDLADDAVAVAEYLRADPRIDGARIFYAGMSQGAAIGAMAATHADAAGVVLMSAPGLQGEDALRQQLETTISLLNIDGQRAARFRAFFDEYVAIVGGDPDARETRDRLVAFLQGPGRALIPPYRFLPRDAAGLADILLDEWYQSNLRFEPAAAYGGLTTPVLAIGGGKDVVAPPNRHLRAIEAILEKQGRVKLSVQEFPNLNHLLMPADSGLPTEYAKLSTSFSEDAIAMIESWLTSNAHGSPDGPDSSTRSD